MRDCFSKQGRSREPTPGNKKQKNKKYSLSLYTQVLPSNADIKAALPLPCRHRKAMPRNCFCSFLGDPGSSWQWERAMKTSHGNWFGVVNVQLVSEGKRSCPMTLRFWTVVVVIQNACKIWQFGSPTFSYPVWYKTSCVQCTWGSLILVNAALTFLLKHLQ